MNLLWTSPLGPAGLLLGGGALLLLLQRRLPERWRQILPVLLVLAGIASWLLLRWQPPGEGRWWAWMAPLGLETGLGGQWDGQVWLAGWLMGLSALTAVLLPGWRARAGFIPPAFWIPFLLALGLLVISAATWSALLLSWAAMLFFAGLLAGSPQVNAPRAWTYLLLSGLFLLLTPLFNGADSIFITIHTETLNIQAQLLLLLAAAIPMAIYPLHLWLTPKTDGERWQGAQLALHLLPALAAFYLLSQFPLPLLSSFSWIALSIAGLLGSALAAWTARKEETVWIYILINRATWTMLAFSLSRDGDGYRLATPLATLALSLAIWALGATWIKQKSPSSSQTRWLRLLMFLFLMGFPLTPGFALNIHVAQLFTVVSGLPGWTLVILAQMLIAAAILRPLAPSTMPSRADFLPAGRIAWILALFAAFGLWWGIFPASLARTAGLPPSRLYTGLLTQIRAAGPIAGWLTLLLPALLGWVLAQNRKRIFAGFESWQERVAETADLSWFENLATAAFRYIAIAFGFTSDILDGAGQFGWVLLALLIFWLLFR